MDRTLVDPVLAWLATLCGTFALIGVLWPLLQLLTYGVSLGGVFSGTAWVLVGVLVLGVATLVLAAVARREAPRGGIIAAVVLGAVSLVLGGIELFCFFLAGMAGL